MKRNREANVRIYMIAKDLKDIKTLRSSKQTTRN